MTSVVLWKELREQRSIWLALVAAAWLALVGLPVTFDLMGITAHNGLREYLAGTLVVLVWTYGLVCGGMLLAGERESGGIHFLDNLPGLRLRLWCSKTVSGLALVIAQVAAVSGLALAYALPANAQEIAGGTAVLLAAGLLGYVWGLLVSSHGSNVLTSVALAIFYQPVAALFLYAIVYTGAAILALFANHSRTSLEPLAIAAVTCILLIAGPLVGSALIFSATDRDRLRSPAHRMVRREKPTTQRPNDRVLLWLTYRQSRRLMIGLVICCAIGGFVLLAAGLALWIVGTLLIGVVCGVTVFMDEQTSGSFRFLGDQRFPLGRIWWVKVGYHFLLACGAALLLLLPALLRELIQALDRGHLVEDDFFLASLFRSGLLRTLIPTWICLGLWLVYGFSISLLCGLLFRRSLIAFVVGLMMSVMITSVWLPSMLGGGLNGWQVWGVPVLLLVLARVLMHPWSSDRLLTPGSIVAIAASLLLLVLWIAGSQWYRVVEVPDVPDRWNMPEFVAGLPTPEENKAGEKIRSAAAALESWEKQHAHLKPTKPLLAGMKFDPKQPFTYQLWDVLDRGWPDAEPELGGWLDLVFKAKWAGDLAGLADLPLGVVEDPRNMTTTTPLRYLQVCRTMDQLLSVRGLQEQARGNPRVFLENLRISLALSRNLRHDAIIASVLVGWALESSSLRGLERWLEKLDGHPLLLREALTLLLHHEAKLPVDEEQMQKAEYLVSLNSLTVPELILDPYRYGGGYRSDEAEMIRVAWQVPWERERHLRLLRALYQGTPQEKRAAMRMSPPEMVMMTISSPNIPMNRRTERARLHAAQLQVALRLYQAETGKPAANLSVLTPKYLARIPSDPFDDEPFRYRLSSGEWIGWSGNNGVRGERRVDSGQGILWSVGSDKRNDGGKTQALNPTRPEKGEDLIFLVPLPSGKGK